MCGSLLSSCTSKSNQKKNSTPVRDDELLPPIQYSEWLNLNSNELEKLLTEKTKPNEKFWLLFRLFDLNKVEDKAKACSFLGSTQSISSNYQFASFIQYNYGLYCSDEFPNIQTMTDLENRLYRDLQNQNFYKKGMLTNDLNLKITYGIEQANLEKNRNLKLQFYKALERELESSQDLALKNLFYAALQKEFPQFLPLKDSTRLEIANDLIKDRNFDQARKHLNFIIKNKNAKLEEINKAFKILFRLEKTTQDKKKQLQVLTLWWKWLLKQKKLKRVASSPFDNWFSELLVLKARWHWTEGDSTLANQLLSKNQKLIKDPTKKEELFYTLGRIYDEKKQFNEAKFYYDQSFKLSSGKSSIFEKNLWSLAWLEYKNKNYLDSQNHLELLISKLQDEPDSKYKYWLAKNYLLQDKHESYKNTIQLLRENEPLSFYTLLTYRDQNEKIPTLLKSSQSDKYDFIKESLRSVLSPEEFKLILWHLSLKQNSILKEGAKYLLDKNPDQFLPALLLLAKSELYANLITSINRLNNSQKKELLQKYPELLFPTPYWQTVLQYTQKRNLFPSFVYSIMRQESAFDPFARSPVDALGLLQLMPPLGKKLAKEENIEFNHEFDLFKEEVNIALGTKELSTLLSRNNNKYIAAIAGYNASIGAFNGWVKNRYREDILEFIEEIPYEETRTYIKLIIRNMIFYDRLYFQKQDFLFPNYLLSL